MEKFYITFGTDHIFHGGYAIVEAESKEAALQRFAEYNNQRQYLETGVLVSMCCSIYTESEWKGTSMAQKGTNLGKGLMQELTCND